MSRMIGIILLAIVLILLGALIETGLIIFIASLFSIKLKFKIVFFIVLIFNLFFKGGASASQK
jgi:hypothetical protein